MVANLQPSVSTFVVLYAAEHRSQAAWMLASSAFHPMFA
jgi:hypothetical protein